MRRQSVRSFRWMLGMNEQSVCLVPPVLRLESVILIQLASRQGVNTIAVEAYTGLLSTLRLVEERSQTGQLASL